MGTKQPPKPHQHLAMLPDALEYMIDAMERQGFVTLSGVDAHLSERYGIRTQDRQKMANGVDKFTNKIAWMFVALHRYGFIAEKRDRDVYVLSDELCDRSLVGMSLEQMWDHFSDVVTAA